MLTRAIPLLLGVVGPACSGKSKESDSAPDSPTPDTATLLVTLVLDHSGCEGDPHEHSFEVRVYSMPEYVTAATFDTVLDTTTSVELPPARYGVYGHAGWSPDGPSDSDWTSNCGCATALPSTKNAIELAAGETIEVTAPVVCGSTLPD